MPTRTLAAGRILMYGLEFDLAADGTVAAGSIACPGVE
jgi:hypothetical protein